MSFRMDFCREVALELAKVKEVEAVFTSQLKGPQQVFFVWAVVPGRDTEVYRRIFEREQVVMERWKPLQFDFTIMPSNGKPPQELVTEPCASLVYLHP